MRRRLWRLGPLAALLVSPSAAQQPGRSGLAPREVVPSLARELPNSVSRAPDSASAQLAAARDYAAAGRWPLAEKHALSAIRIRKSLEALLILANATMRMNRLNESIGWLDEAARLRPDQPEIYRILGLDYSLGGMLPEGIAAFRRAVQLAPANWEHHYFLGRALFDLGRPAEALPVLREAARLAETSPRAWTALGQTQERLGDCAGAESNYRRAIAVCGSGRECAWPLLQLGFLVGMENGPAASIPHYRRAVEARPDWARAHFHLGKALAATDDPESARKELESAVLLDGAQPEYHYQLATLYRRLGEGEKALAELARFRALRAGASKVAPQENLEP